MQWSLTLIGEMQWVLINKIKCSKPEANTFEYVSQHRQFLKKVKYSHKNTFIIHTKLKFYLKIKHFMSFIHSVLKMIDIG